VLWNAVSADHDPDKCERTRRKVGFTRDVYEMCHHCFVQAGVGTNGEGDGLGVACATIKLGIGKVSLNRKMVLGNNFSDPVGAAYMPRTNRTLNGTRIDPAEAPLARLCKP
jgi:hypothetical protein